MGGGGEEEKERRKEKATTFNDCVAACTLKGYDPPSNFILQEFYRNWGSKLGVIRKKRKMRDRHMTEGGAEGKGGTPRRP